MSCIEDKEFTEEEMKLQMKRTYIAIRRPIWQAEGRRFRRVREALKISQNDLCELMGFSSKTIASFEAGRPIRNARYLKHSYRLAIKYIQANRREIEREL